MKTEQKLTISHIQHYPIGGENALRVQYKNEIKKVVGINGDCYPTIEVRIDDKVARYASIHIRDTKPLLLPLSALYEEINGEIGIVELAKMAFPKRKFELRRSGCWCDAEKFMYDKATNSFRTLHEEGGCFSQGHEITNQLALFAYLFSHHYDVFDLCSKGLAIDKRTITNKTL